MLSALRFLFISFLVQASVLADPILEIEHILMQEASVKADIEAIRSTNKDAKVAWALERAVKYQELGDFDLRNKFLSLALVQAQRDEVSQFTLKSPMAPSKSQTRKSMFESVYKEEDSLSVQASVDQAVQEHIDSEAWFVSVLDKLGVMSKNYKEWNDKLRAQYPNLTKAQLADKLVSQTSNLTAGVGFAANLPGSIPIAGTAAQLALSAGAIVPDMIYMFKQQATLVFRIAELYGQDMQAPERVTEALILFGVASGVSAATKALEQYVQKGLTTYIQTQAGQKVIEQAVTRVSSLHPILREIIVNLVGKEAISQALVERTSTTILPLIGAGISGAVNYVFTRQVGSIAKAYYGDDSAKRLEAVNGLKMPKVELAMFRGLVLVILADGEKKPEEVMALQKTLQRFPHNKALVERMLAGDEDLLNKSDYDLSQESDAIKEHVLYALTCMEYVDSEKGPSEIELHDKILAKFKIAPNLANEIELRVKTEKNMSPSETLDFLGKLYRGYQKAVGAREETKF